MEKRRLLIGCEFTYVAAIPTPVVLQVQPVESPRISIEDVRWASEPVQPARAYTDLYGNPCVRAVLPAGPVALPVPGRGGGSRRGRRVGRGRAGMRGRYPSRRYADLHSAEPVLPARCARQRGVVAFGGVAPGSNQPSHPSYCARRYLPARWPWACRKAVPPTSCSSHTNSPPTRSGTAAGAAGFVSG